MVVWLYIYIYRFIVLQVSDLINNIHDGSGYLDFQVNLQIVVETFGHNIHDGSGYLDFQV